MAVTYTPIASIISTGSGSGFNFTSIPSTYTDLVIACSVRSSKSGSSVEEFDIRVGNGSFDSGSNYSYTSMTGNGSTASSSRTSNQTVGMRVNIPAATATANFFATIIINIQNYSNSTTYKNWLVRNSDPGSNATALVGLWRNTTVIDSVAVFTEGGNNLTAGSIATLYGIKSA